MIPENKPKLCIVAGLPRAGSTFLYHNLGLHPELFSPFRKETNYFLSNYKRGLQWYLSLFSDANIHHKYCLDVSPSYFIDTKTIGRIKQYSSNSKIIMVIRDLDELAVSWYEQQLTHVNQFISFDSFLTDWTAKRGDETVHIDMRLAPFKKSIQAYKEAFGQDLLIIEFSQIKTNSLGVLKAIEHFLGLDDFYAPDNYDNLAINARNRNHLKPLTWLLSNEKVITLIHRLFPRNIIIKSRAFIDKMSTPKKPRKPQCDPRKSQAKQVLQEDIQFVESLFSIGSIQLGDGTVICTSHSVYEINKKETKI